MRWGSTSVFEFYSIYGIMGLHKTVFFEAVGASSYLGGNVLLRATNLPGCPEQSRW
jgi:hypothetical protein